MKKKIVASAKSSNDFRFKVFIFILAFVLYGNTIPNFYSLDDELVTKDSPQVKKGIAGIGEIFFTRLSSGLNIKNNNYGYRPIAKSTFAIEHQFFGQNPHISHFFNVLFYALTGLFLFYLLKKLFKDLHPLLPFITTVLFLIHPVHTEVVASLKNRDELLAFIGCLAVLHFVLRYVETKKMLFVFLAALAMIFAYYSKQDSLTWVAVIPLVLYFYTNESVKRISMVMVVIVAMVLAVHLLVRKFLPEGNRIIMFYENPLYFDKDLLVRTATGFYALAFYLKMLLFPHPLSFYYGFNQIPIVGWTNVVTIASFLFFSALGVFALLKFKSKHVLSFSILYFICTISIYANMVVPMVGIVADRFLYMASLGFCIAGGYLITKLFKGNTIGDLFKSRNAAFASVLILLLCLFKTISRNKDWKTDATLYAADIPHLENSVIALDKAAGTLVRDMQKEKDGNKQREMIDEAIRLYKKSIEVYPDFAEGMNNLATIYTNYKDDNVSAEKLLEKSVALDSTNTQSKFNLAFCYAKNGKKEKAIAMYEGGLKKQPRKDINNFVNLANIYFETGNIGKAIEILGNAEYYFPESDLPRFNTGMLYFKTGDTLNAIANWERAIEKNPTNKNLCMAVGKYYEKHKNLEKSDYYLKKAGMMQPNH